MKKPLKKRKVIKKPKEDNKSDVVYVRYLLEDMAAVAELIPADEKVELKDEALDLILAAVKKVHVRVKTISVIFKKKYAAARFDKVESVSSAILKKGKENPRFKYSFLIKEYKACQKEIANSIVPKTV